MSVRVVDGDLVTAYGVGIDACWDGLLHRRSAVKPVTRFSTKPFQCHSAATLDGLTSGEGDSIVCAFLRMHRCFWHPPREKSIFWNKETQKKASCRFCSKNSAHDWTVPL